jgi:hypothetical protein
MVAKSEDLATLRAWLILTGSAYLRNVAWVAGTTCTVCAGVPGIGYSVCIRCYQRKGLHGLADRLGFITYAWPQHQSGHVMHGYKAPAPTPASRALVATLLSYGIVAHWPCMAGPAGELPDAWATVPSLKARPGLHPITTIAQAPLKAFPQVPVVPSPLPGDPRGFVPANFSVGPIQADHVLLLDDTWATGGHLQSAAAALKASGAKRVTTLVVARWLDPTWADTPKVINSLKTDFDPDVCPFTGKRC